MADIRINGLPLATGPTAPAPTDVVAIDGTTTRKSVLSDLANAIRPVASQTEAQVGTNATKTMTPLTTAQAILAQVSTVGISGDYNDLASKPVLGTASAEDSTAFATAAQGTLASSALQTGSFGLGRGTSGAPTLITNIDDTTLPNGFYQAQTTTTGTLPNASAQGIVLIERYSGTWVKQTWTNRADASSGTRGGLTFSRVYNNTTATWGAWVQVISSGQKATSPQAVTGTDDTNYTTSLAVAAAIDGRSSAVITGGLSRTAPARFGDVVDLDERLPGDGTTPINGTPLTNLLTYMAANPNKTYRSRKNRKYFLNAAVAFPDGIKLRLEGAEFYLGASLTTGTTALTLGADTDTDEIRLRVLGANTVYRGILVGDRFRGGLVAYSDNQQANSGNQLYRAIRITGNDCDLDYVESRFFDFGVLVHGESAANTGTVIRRLKAQSYCNAVKIRDVSDFRLQDYTVTGRSANGLSNPGQNGVLVEGAQYSQFHDGYIEGSPEHGFRFGGFGSFVNTKACKVGGLNVKSSGQTGVKAYTGSLASVMQDMSFSDITVIDAGDNGDAVGFNDFGYMLQNINGLHATGLTVKNRDLAVCALDGFYLSSITRGEMNGLQVYSAARNAMRISEYNDDGTNSGGISTLDVIGLQSESHAAAGVYLEFPGSQAIRHMVFKDTHLIGGTTGFDGNAAGGRFLQPSYFEGVIVGQSGARFNLPGSTNINSVDLLDRVTGTATYDPPSLVDGAGATTTVTVTGAALGDYTQATFSLDIQGITLTSWVSSANTISVRFQNETGGTIDLASGTLKAKVTKT